MAKAEKEKMRTTVSWTSSCSQEAYEMAMCLGMAGSACSDGPPAPAVAEPSPGWWPRWWPVAAVPEPWVRADTLVRRTVGMSAAPSRPSAAAAMGSQQQSRFARPAIPDHNTDVFSDK